MTIMVLAWLLPTLLAFILLLLATTKKPLLSNQLSAEIVAGLLIASFPFIFILAANWLVVGLLVFIQLCALLLVARLLFGRLDKAFVLPSTRRNALGLTALLLATIVIWILDSAYPSLFGDIQWLLGSGLAAILLLQCLFFAQHIWARRHFKLALDASRRPLGELPTVSVCIPARNEDHALTDCLTRVLASTYPKLEVIVLDDCSQDKTSQIIRSFAHEGVRFIRGEVPADGWLGKNQARQTLAEHASGDFLFFVDVDTRLQTDSIAQLVDYALDSRLSMVAVLPQNRLGFQPGALLDTMRFYWQQVLPITRRRVPAASQAWLIETDAFRKLGGFKSVAHKVVPEASFARRLSDTNAYRFIAGSPALGVTTAKKWRSELASAIRLLYPTYKRQPLVALGVAALIAALFIVPPVLTILCSFESQDTSVFYLAGTAWIVAAATYGWVRQQTHPRIWPVMVLLLPFTALQEVILIFTSLMQYEFGEVNWKGRNICYPVIALSAQNPPVSEVWPVRR